MFKMKDDDVIHRCFHNECELCKRDGNIRPKYNIDDKLFVIGEINGKKEIVECKITVIYGSRARFKYTISKVDSCFPYEWVSSFDLWQDELDNKIGNGIFLNRYVAMEYLNKINKD